MTTLTEHGSLAEGLRIALSGEEAGSPNPLASWLAANPEQAADLARALADPKGTNPPAPASPSPSQIGGASLVGGLDLREEIGRGAMGVVYRAVDPVLKREVAVKFLRAVGGLSPQELARFRFEAEVVASLDHPNVVRVHASGETGGVPYLVMPLLTATLSQRLKELGPDQRMPAEEAARLLRGIALGVHHAHQRGLIHRDLKPGNILLDAAGGPHVADFGLARPANVTTTGADGTPAYMAPEQARAEKHLTTAVDVHALGVILYELLTGVVPYGGNIGSILRQLTDPTVQAPGVRDSRPDVPPDLEAICLQCLEKDPAKRYSSARALAEDLGRFLNGESVSARRPGFWDWLGQVARTRPEPNPNYSWPVTVWFGILVLATNAVIYGMVRADLAAGWVWIVTAGCAAVMGLVLWWYMLRRFRTLPVTERHSLIIAVGYILTFLSLIAAYVPLSFSAPARDGLGVYPALSGVSALCLFTLGSTNWSRFFPIATAFMAFAPIMARWPEESPLVYGASHALVMWYWSVAKAGGFVPRAADATRSPALL